MKLRAAAGIWVALAAATLGAGAPPAPSLDACRHRLEQVGIKYKSFQPAGTNQMILDLENCGLSSLAPLKGMPLTCLNISGNGMTNLMPLVGMPLQMLSMSGTRVVDLAPLKGMPLQYLDLGGCPVRSLEPLKGMPLETLYLNGTAVSDLSPLKGMPMKIIVLNSRLVKDGVKGLRDMPALAQIGVDSKHNPMAARDFWARYDKGEFSQKSKIDSPGEPVAPAKPAPSAALKTNVKPMVMTNVHSAARPNSPTAARTNAPPLIKKTP